VTATRREESLSKVPISVSAYTQESLDEKGVKDMSELVRYIPGVSIDQTVQRHFDSCISSSGGAALPASTSTIRRSRCDRSVSTGRRAAQDFRSGSRRGTARSAGTLFGAGSEGGTVRYILTAPS